MTAGRTVVLHIGTEKTGTTSLQSVLSANREALRRAGVAYLSSPGRIEARGLAAAALEDRIPDEHLRDHGMAEPDARARFRAQAVRELHEAMDSLPAEVHTVVLSSEHFHSRVRRASEAAWLADVLEGRAANVRVVAYLRRQVDVLNSFYSTELKNGGRRTLSQAAEKMCHPGNHYFAYGKMLSLWAEAFGEDAVVPRVYDRDELAGGDLVSDFLSFLGAGGAGLQRSGEVRLNESLTPLGQALVRGINLELAERSSGDRVAEDLGAMRREAIKSFAGTGATLPLDKAREVQATFDEENRAVRDRWFPERERLFAEVTPDTYREVAREGPPTAEQVELVRRTLDLAEQKDVNGRRLHHFDQCAVMLRDAAVAQEGSDPRSAEASMLLAGRIRPNGPFIHRRLALYAENRRTTKWLARLAQRLRGA